MATILSNLKSAAERPTSLAAHAREIHCHDKPECGPRPVKRLGRRAYAQEVHQAKNPDPLWLNPALPASIAELAKTNKVTPATDTHA